MSDRSDRSIRRPLVAVLAALALLGAACTDDGGDDASTGRDEDTDVTVLGAGDDYEATIRRTEGGVAHVTADDVESLAFGQGWASAQDRACDLADQVVKISSQRSRWFGVGEDDEHLRSDLAWASIGIRERAEKDWGTASEEVRTLVTAYTEGWNGHLAEVGSEGISDWCAGEEWVRALEPVEVYAYARAIALQASSGAVDGYIATAEPPSDPGDGDETDETDETDGNAAATPAAAAAAASVRPVMASNGWAIGSDRATDGGGMLVGNPHFPWEGELRFWEVHLTIPGEIDIYGAQLSGLPGIGIGFTEDFAWTHTVSAGNRFTAYRLDLVEGSPTTYRYGDDEREMERQDLTLEVLGEDGTLSEQTRTLWHSHYGPMLDFPGVGWSEDTAITFRDANIDNDEFIEQYLHMMQAGSLDELIDVHREHSGVPLFNTIAASSDGRAWYADTSATPKLSEEAIAEYEALLESDPLVAGASSAGAVLLDGSDPRFEWQEVDGARDPGLVPFDEMPVVERDDYVFNANDSFWMAHATEMLEGDYSPLHGHQRTSRSPRTRENATVLHDTSVEGPAGDDGTFTLDELADAALANRGYTARALLDDVVGRCEGARTVSLPADDSDSEVFPAAEVDLTEACEVLAGWDGVYDIDRSGPPLWREFLSRHDASGLNEAGALWAEPFDPDDPVETPSGLAGCPAGTACAIDPALERLARAVQVLASADLEPDVTLGEVQSAVRNGELIPIHGGTGWDGTTNVVGFGSGWSTLDPTLEAIEREPIVAGSMFAEVTGDTATSGYRVNNGTSFLFVVQLGDGAPRAKAFLTYGNTADRDDPAYTDATQDFSDKEWRDVLFDAEDVAGAATSTVTVKG